MKCFGFSKDKSWGYFRQMFFGRYCHGMFYFLHFPDHQPWAEHKCMILRTMTFMMMEKDQDVAKITLEEEVSEKIG